MSYNQLNPPYAFLCFILINRFLMFTSALEWIQRCKWCSFLYRKKLHWSSFSIENIPCHMCLFQCGKKLIYLLLVLSWTCSQTEITLSILPFQVDPNEMTHQMYRIVLCKSHLFIGHAFAKHKDNTKTCQTTLWERLAYVCSCKHGSCMCWASVGPTVLLGFCSARILV